MLPKSQRKQNFQEWFDAWFFFWQQIFPGLCAEDAATTFASTVACTTTALLIAPKTRPFGEIMRKTTHLFLDAFFGVGLQLEMVLCGNPSRQRSKSNVLRCSMAIRRNHTETCLCLCPCVVSWELWYPLICSHYFAFPFAALQCTWWDELGRTKYGATLKTMSFN